MTQLTVICDTWAGKVIQDRSNQKIEYIGLKTALPSVNSLLIDYKMTNRDDAYYKKFRVFIHELGHFVAQTFNEKYYEGLGPEYIRITRVPTENQLFDYVGGTKRKNYSSEVVLKHPASLIASAAYGCFFQCIYYEDPLETCLTTKYGGGYGYTDREGINQVLIQSTGGLEVASTIFFTIARHFERIKDHFAFDQVNTKEIDALIISDQEEFFIQPDELLIEIEFLFPLYEEYYKSLVEDIEKVLQPHLRDKI